MNESAIKIWNEERNANISKVMANIADVSTMQNFLRDIMTEKEIDEIAARLQAASMLKVGKTYASIVKQTGLSSRTVARISDWLKNGAKGYDAALTIAEKHHIHLSPARD
ncbi:MAG TPA: YerC/YecD family TrpR-related protein [Dongiaceae bacterium]|nr:YerC/YecD family TrpR-related protein [Dongiaceae bacterium]